MANITSILFNTADSISGCRSRIQELLGITFNEEQDGGTTRYIYGCFGIELTLFDNHGLVNDMGIRFEDFVFELDLLVMMNGVSANVAEAFRLAAGRYLFELIATRLKWNCIVVDNFQRVIASFPEGGTVVRS